MSVVNKEMMMTSLYDLSWLDLRALTEVESVRDITVENEFTDDHLPCLGYRFVDNNMRVWNVELWWLDASQIHKLANEKFFVAYIKESATEELSTMGGDYVECEKGIR